MGIAKPSIPKGTRDFSPLEMSRRNFIFDTIKEAFRLFGFQQIETPAQENLSTLMGKYGEEGDKLLFKILNSGDFLSGTDRTELQEIPTTKLASIISEKGLRYDLTVPFARYVVQHRNDIRFPFKRYQIQPVWRADRPQKGRYREFYQCDADIIGSTSLLNEVELLQLIETVFNRLGINIAIKLNNRKILAGIAETIGEPDRLTDITVAIDKIDKIGIDAVNQELKSRGLTDKSVEALQPFLKISGSTDERLQQLKEKLSGSETGLKGIEETEFILTTCKKIGTGANIELDVSLARGLNYYTGSIIEVKASDVEIGSISGGGRYDNLTGIFGMPDVSGVGISFGADRIYDVMLALSLFPDSTNTTVDILFVNFGEKEAEESLKIIGKLREAGISAELYPDTAKMKKQLGYASDEKIKYVAMIGETEIENSTVGLKDMEEGVQQTFSVDKLIQFLKK